MAGYKGHIAGGLVLGGVALGAAVWAGQIRPTPEMAATLLAIAVLGALFPDVDTDSKGQNLFYSVLLLLDLALMITEKYKWAAVVGFCAMLPAVGRHRGWTHTWWAMLLVPVPVLVLPALFYRVPLERLTVFYLAAVVGYFSHLLLDRKFT